LEGNEISEPSVLYTPDSIEDILELHEEIPNPAVIIKKEKINSKLVSLELFKTGNTIEEIAKERGMTVSTIESHLAHYVGKGELEIQKLVPTEKIVQITDYYINNPESGLTPAKIALGENISYGELRLVLQYLEYQKQIVH
jgi:uncharacterized protein YpbB